MKTKILTLAISLFFAVSLYAQNENDALRLSDPGILGSARSLGMGNSIGAFGGDFSSIYLNPAGLGLFRNSEITIGGYNNNFKNNTTFYNTSGSASQDATNFSQFGIVYKVPVSRGSLVLSIGYNRSKDFNRMLSFNGFNPDNNSMIQDLTGKQSDFAYLAGVSYPVNNSRDTTLIKGKLQQSGKTTDEGGVDNWSFAGAMEVQKDLFVGVTLNVISGKFERNKSFTETDPYGMYSTIRLDPSDSRTLGLLAFNYYDGIKWDLSGWGMQLGLIYKIKERGSIGFAIKIPEYFNITESYRVGSSGIFTTHAFDVTPSYSTYDYKITTPWEFSFGGSYSINRLTLAGNIKYIDYTQMKFTEGLTSADREDINWAIKDIFRSVVNYNFGIEYALQELGVKLRGGLMVTKSPYKDDPSDYDKKFITGGIGIPFEQMEFDLGVAYGWWKDFGYNYTSASRPVDQDIKSTTIMLGLKYHF
jgi:hypothetical protein